MTNPTRRNSLRYPGFDYSSPTGIFITIATHERQELFGDDDTGLSESGKAAHDCWRGIPDRFRDVLIDVFVVMPDHIHGILWMG